MSIHVPYSTISLYSTPLISAVGTAEKSISSLCGSVYLSSFILLDLPLKLILFLFQTRKLR